MQQNSGGSKVNIGSIFSNVGYAGDPAICPRNHGLEGHAKTAAIEGHIRIVELENVRGYHLKK